MAGKNYASQAKCIVNGRVVHTVGTMRCQKCGRIRFMPTERTVAACCRIIQPVTRTRLSSLRKVA